MIDTGAYMRKYTVLIVDDEPNVTRLLEKVFLKADYITYTACNGSKAIEMVECHAIDYVITDLKMPGMNGIELLKKIKEIDSSIKIIMITAFATVETAVEALKLGACDYITKPFDIDEVLLTVKKIGESMHSVDNMNCMEREDGRLIENFLVSRSPAMVKVIELIRQVADTRTTAMIYGETGTGKEIAAQLLHTLSSRKNEPFIKVNCSAIPENLLESELFGYEKGAFTGASARKPGRFELADGGSIFLDEIGDISPMMQVKLLRVLQQREFERLGGTKTLKVDVRIIAATNKNLHELVENNLFRQDLYYRLNVVPIMLPPLRERKEDIIQLSDYFLEKSSRISGKAKKKITKKAMEMLIGYNWPGNIRELENVIERCVVITRGESIDCIDLPADFQQNKNEGHIASVDKLDSVLDSAEKDIIIKSLRECNGNRTKASEVLGISRRSLHRKIIKYNIED
jgi:DNA-binding NtrC family response regulator